MNWNAIYISSSHFASLDSIYIHFHSTSVHQVYIYNHWIMVIYSTDSAENFHWLSIKRTNEIDTLYHTDSNSVIQWYFIQIDTFFFHFQTFHNFTIYKHSKNNPIGDKKKHIKSMLWSDFTDRVNWRVFRILTLKKKESKERRSFVKVIWIGSITLNERNWAPKRKKKCQIEAKSNK